MIFTCIIPVPPSVNTMFIERREAGKKGRSLSYAYRKWRDEAGVVIMKAWRDAGCPEIPKPFAVELYIGVNHQSDIDNRIKAAIDALCKAVKTPGDQWIDRILAVRSARVGHARITVYDMRELP